MWQTFAGHCIYHNEQGILIAENHFYRWLKIDSDALQTLLNKNSPSKPGLHYIKALIFMAQQMPGNCCLLGLGGAGAAHALSPSLDGYKITAVELNKDIIQLASRFFMTDMLVNLEIIHQDASIFVQQKGLQFNHMLVDLFNAHSFPDNCNNVAFFRHCQEQLLPNGILAVNLANRHEQKPIFEMISQVFSGNTVSIPVRHCANLVILASHSGNINWLLNALKTSRKVKKLTWSAQWGCLADMK